jgi:hypothetical protein
MHNFRYKVEEMQIEDHQWVVVRKGYSKRSWMMNQDRIHLEEYQHL